MRERGFTKYIVIIIVILVVVFLSQRAYLFKKGNTFTFVSDAMSQAQAYLAKGSGWVSDNVFPKISGEVQKRGDMIKSEVNKEKEKVSENIGEKIQNYFSGIADSVLHPGENNNCQSQPAETSASQ
jgi:hypothetical protein